MPSAVPPTTPAVASALSVLTPAVFVALSSGLTGISVNQLKPAFDPVDAAGRFYDALRARVPAPVLDQIAATFLAAPTPAEGAASVLDDPDLGAIGSSLLKLWLVGAWHDPSTPTVAVTILPPHLYRQSRAWQVMQLPRALPPRNA